MNFIFIHQSINHKSSAVINCLISFLTLSAPLEVFGSSDLLQSKSCTSCHNGSPGKGPSFSYIREKYQGADPKKFEQLVNTTIYGGVGVWGAVPMPPQRHVSPQEAQSMIAGILDIPQSVKQEKENIENESSKLMKSNSKNNESKCKNYFNIDGNYNLEFSPLISKTLSTRELEEIYEYTKKCIDPSMGKYRNSRFDFPIYQERKGGDRGSDFCYGPVQNYYDKVTLNDRQWLIDLSKARYDAYACNRAAGWPSATDYVPPSKNKNQAEATNQKNQSQKSSEKNSQSNAEELISGQQQMGALEQKLAESSVQIAPGDGKKIYLPDLGGKCLRIVDIKEDHDVRGMYWFALENICNESIKAHWCDLKTCNGTNMAASIAPGAKEQSWTSVSKFGRHPSKLKGVACQIEYRGASVYKESRTNKCYSWRHHVR